MISPVPSRAAVTIRPVRGQVVAGAPAGPSGDRPRDDAHGEHVFRGSAHSSGPAAGGRAPAAAEPGVFTPFVAQVAALALGDAGAGDRRVRRQPTSVMPRAEAAYRAAQRLATNLEPGFLLASSA